MPAVLPTIHDIAIHSCRNCSYFIEGKGCCNALNKDRTLPAGVLSCENFQPLTLAQEAFVRISDRRRSYSPPAFA